MLVGFTYLAAYIFASVVFIRWLRLITSNLGALTTVKPRYGTGWATGGWFVPFPNLWRPKQVIDQAWRVVSEDGPLHRGESRGGRHGRVPALFAVWWALLVVVGVVTNVAARALIEGETVDELRTASQVYLAADIGDLVSGTLALFLIARLTTRQRVRASELGLADGMPGGVPAEAAPLPAAAGNGPFA